MNALPLRSERLVIDRMCSSDRSDIITLLDDAEVQNYVCQITPMDDTTKSRYYNMWLNRDYVLVARTSVGCQFVGVVGTKQSRNNRMLFVAVTSSQRRSKFADEMCRASIPHFRQVFPEGYIQAEIEKSNIPSLTLAQRLGCTCRSESDTKTIFTLSPEIYVT